MSSETQEKKQAEPNRERRRVLFVDDDEKARNSISKILAAPVYEVRVVGNVNEAAKVLADHDFEFIISDVEMPLKTGLDLFRWCLESGVNSHGRPTPFLFLTTPTELLDAAGAKRLGACGFIQRPFKEEELLSVLERELTPQEAPAVAESLFYAPLPLEEFRTFRAKQISLFIETDTIWPDAGMNVLQGLQLDDGALRPQDIRSFSDKGIQRFFMLTSDYSRHVGISSRVERLARGEILERQAAFLKMVQGAYTARISHFSSEVQKLRAFHVASDIVDGSLKALFGLRASSGSLALFNEMNPTGFARAVQQATIALGTANQMGFLSTPVLSHMAFSALLAPIRKPSLDHDPIEEISIRVNPAPLTNILEIAEKLNDFSKTITVRTGGAFEAEMRTFSKTLKIQNSTDAVDAVIRFLSGRIPE